MNGPGRRPRWSAAIVLLIAVSVSCREVPTTSSSPPRIQLRLHTGPPGGGFNPLGERIARVLQERITGLDIETVASAGAVANIRAIQSHQADLGFSFADVAYVAFNGELAEAREAFDRLRAIAVLQLSPIALVARPGTTIRGPADLRGRAVGVGPAGSGTAITATLILEAFGLNDRQVRREYIGFQEASSRLLAGSLDAMFDNAISQSASVLAALAGGARLVPIDGPAVVNFRREYPFMKLASIGPELYPGLVEPVRTLGVDGLLVCRADLDEPLVYTLTRQLFESQWLPLDRGGLHQLDIEQAPATPIPLHEGAARYFRERELSR